VTHLAIRVARLQNAIVRELNDSHIFVRQALPLLEQARGSYASSPHKKDRRYYVPSVARSKFARRKDRELREIYDRFTSTRLYEAFLITAIGEFEAFLGRVLKEILVEYPQKLSIAVPGIPPYRQLPLEVLIKASTRDEALAGAVSEQLRAVFFASPKAYLDYVSKVAGVQVGDVAFADYLELKATRDLLVHNARQVNEIYLEKAGAKARGQLGDAIPVDSAYFDAALATMKRLSGIVKRDVEKAFPRNRGAAQQGVEADEAR
jgi:hypothetical protein